MYSPPNLYAVTVHQLADNPWLVNIFDNDDNFQTVSTLVKHRYLITSSLAWLESEAENLFTDPEMGLDTATWG